MAKEYVLIDLSHDRWKDVDKESVIDCVDDIKDRISKRGPLLGEIASESFYSRADMDILLVNASHRIVSVRVKGDVVYGEVEFLNNEKGNLAEYTITELNGKFGVRGWAVSDGLIVFNRINTLDVLPPAGPGQEYSITFKSQMS